MRRKTNGVHLCLCGTCASFFYNSKEHRIYRVDMLQVITEECFFCRDRRGYDFILEDIPNKKSFRFGRNGGGHG